MDTQYLSEAIILKLQQLQQLDALLSVTVPASVTPISFNSIRQAYQEIIDSIIYINLPNYLDTAHECVIYVCIAKCREQASANALENLGNVHEDLLNRIRYGLHLHLYEYRSADRFDNMIALMVMDEEGEGDNSEGATAYAEETLVAENASVVETSSVSIIDNPMTLDELLSNYDNEEEFEEPDFDGYVSD